MSGCADRAAKAHTRSLITLTRGAARRIILRIQFPSEMGLYSELLMQTFLFERLPPHEPHDIVVPTILPHPSPLPLGEGE
jgi:hypothetical protein